MHRRALTHHNGREVVVPEQVSRFGDKAIISFFAEAPRMAMESA
jgi:hypothetical protein